MDKYIRITPLTVLVLIRITGITLNSPLRGTIFSLEFCQILLRSLLKPGFSVVQTNPLGTCRLRPSSNGMCETTTGLCTAVNFEPPICEKVRKKPFLISSRKHNHGYKNKPIAMLHFPTLFVQ